MTVAGRGIALLVAIGAGSLASLSTAQDLEGLTWAEHKCVLYQHAWNDALDIIGTDGIGEEFVARNSAFVGSGCTARGDVCPRSPQEIEMANLLTVMTMNEGMASTFVPFSCSRNN